MSYINNMNPRRMVWFNQNAPKNKMDLWLSYNKHYEDTSDDETTDPQETTDNPSQRHCDLILKAWDCGQWVPIVGFNTTAANKIDCVSGNNLYHPAIFTGENPNDLYDAGTLGSLLSDSNFVTEQEWHDVFNSSNYDWGDIFGDTNWFGDLIWETIQGGSSSYQLPRAQSNRLGGICANTFDTIAANGFAECKFYNNADSKLYVSGADILDAISESQSSYVDSDVLYRSFYNSPTILKGWQENQTSEQKPRFELAGSTVLSNRGKLLKLKDANDPFWSYAPDDYSNSNNALEWISPEDLLNEYSYELPLASLGALGGIRADRHAGLLPGKFVAECKLYNPNYLAQPNSYRREALCVDVRDVKQALDDWYADNGSTIWDLDIQSNFGISTIKHTSVDDDNVTHVTYAHVLDHYTQSMVDGLYPRNKTYSNPVPGLYNGTKGLEWVNAQTIVEEGLGISSGTGYLYYNGGSFVLDAGTGGGGGGTTYYPLSSSNYTTAGNYVVGVSSGGTGGSNYYLNGLGQWTTPPNTTYNDFSGSAHGLVPASTSASQDKYLKGDGTWGSPTVSAEFDIDLALSIEDDSSFVLDGLRLISTSTSNPVNETLEEWSYYNIDGGNKTIRFTFSNTHVSGNAIYIRFNTGVQTVSINTDTDIIFSNEAMSSSRRQFAANSSYLITIQFGIIKIEKITISSSQENV